ncbi:hypothetical protein AVEN_146678-1, partial [Araneus ventricosus]
LKSVKSGKAKASSMTGATDGVEEISKLVIGGDAFVVESEGFRNRNSRDIFISVGGRSRS